MHHVRFKVVAQRGHADLIVVHRPRHVRITQISGQAHDQGREQAGANQQNQA